MPKWLSHAAATQVLRPHVRDHVKMLGQATRGEAYF